MTVESREEAWKMADSLFPTDYLKDDILSERAGYDIYVSTSKNNLYAHISDLGCRLELNYEDGSAVSIYIKERSKKSNEIKTFADYKSVQKKLGY